MENNNYNLFMENAMCSYQESAIRVRLLVYGAIGHEHSLAIQNTRGLILTAICDRNPIRLKAATKLASSALLYTDAITMLETSRIDLLVISTPPNSHCQWAKEGWHDSAA